MANSFTVRQQRHVFPNVSHIPQTQRTELCEQLGGFPTPEAGVPEGNRALLWKPDLQLGPGCLPRGMLQFTEKPTLPDPSKATGTYRRMNVQILNLLLEFIHHRRHLLQVHGAQSLVQSLSYLGHVFRHLQEEIASQLLPKSKVHHC